MKDSTEQMIDEQVPELLAEKLSEARAMLLESRAREERAMRDAHDRGLERDSARLKHREDAAQIVAMMRETEELRARATHAEMLLGAVLDWMERHENDPIPPVALLDECRAAAQLTPDEPFCCCGRRMSECDGSRAGCRKPKDPCETYGCDNDDCQRCHHALGV